MKFDFIYVRPKDRLAGVALGAFGLISIRDYSRSPIAVPDMPGLEAQLNLWFQDFDPESRPEHRQGEYNGVPIAEQCMRPEHARALWRFLDCLDSVGVRALL